MKIMKRKRDFEILKTLEEKKKLMKFGNLEWNEYIEIRKKF